MGIWDSDCQNLRSNNDSNVKGIICKSQFDWMYTVYGMVKFEKLHPRQMVDYIHPNATLAI